MTNKKFVLMLMLAVMLFSFCGCGQIIQEAGNLIAQDDGLPHGAKIEIVKGLSEIAVQIDVQGVEVTKVEILEHKNISTKPIIVTNRNSFILEKGQSFRIWFKISSKELPKKMMLSGEEYMWGTVPYLSNGLVALPTRRGPSIFVRQHLPKGLQKKIENKEMIRPLM